MARGDFNLQRLLRSAARTQDPVPEMPYGFDTRVLALARGEGPRGEAREIVRMLRRVALIATVVLAFAGSAAVWQLNADDDDETLLNAYAIADTAIEYEALP